MANLNLKFAILKKVYSDRKGVEKEIVLELVERMQSKYTITAILNALVAPRSTNYLWRSEGTDASLKAVEQAIIDICEATKCRYGHRKVRALLQ